MSSQEADLTPLVHKYLRGMQRQKQDGVTFRDFQVRNYKTQVLRQVLRIHLLGAQSSESLSSFI